MKHLSSNVRAMLLCLLPLLISLSLAACRTQESDLPFTTIEQRDTPGIGSRQPGLVVVTMPDQISKLDGFVTSGAQAAVQNLEYDKYFVLVVFQGNKPTAGYSTQIERMIRSGDSVTIYAKFQEPRPDEGKNDTITSPYHLVRVEKRGVWGQSITFNVIVASATVASISQQVP